MSRPCPVCSHPIPEHAGKGRPRAYCSEECREETRKLRQAEQSRDRYAQLREAGASAAVAMLFRHCGAEFRAKLKELQAAGARPFSQSMNANTAPTLVPAAYPELEAEVYASLDPVLDRDTMMPSAGEAEDLAAESRR